MKKNVYSLLYVCNVLKTSLISVWFMLSFNCSFSVHFFQMKCLLVRIEYWNHPLSMYRDQSTVIYLIVHLLIKLCPSMIDAYMFKVVIPCLWIFFFIKCFSFLFLTSFGLKPLVSDIRIAIPTFFLVSFTLNTLFHHFTLRLYLLFLWSIFLRQKDNPIC